MQATAVFAKQLEHYHQLCFHQNPPLAAQLQEVQMWQKNRMQQVHESLFKQPQYQQISNFLLENLYSHANIVGLAQQLDKALQEKIKLDRFLSNNILDAAVLSFELAYLTLKLDEQIAQYLLDHQLQTNTANIHHAFAALNQNASRRQQLDLLAKLSAALSQYAHSFFIQSTFRLAKNTAYRRQFNFLYDYLAQAFRVIRATPQSKHFFKIFIQHEELFLTQITIQPATPVVPSTA